MIEIDENGATAHSDVASQQSQPSERSRCMHEDPTLVRSATQILESTINLSRLAPKILDAARKNYTDRSNAFVIQMDKEFNEDDEQMLAAALETPRFVDLVVGVLETAARSATQEKQQALLYVMRKGLEGFAEQSVIDEAQMCRRTIEALEAVHIRLFTLICDPNVAGTQPGLWSEEELLRRDPDVKLFLRPVLAVLIREGLIESAPQTYDQMKFATFSWRITEFGRLFVRFLSPTTFALPNLGEAELDVSWLSAPLCLCVTNFAFGDAQSIQLFQKTGATSELLATRESLSADEEWRVPLSIRINHVAPPSHSVDIVWSDSRGKQTRTFDVSGVGAYAGGQLVVVGS
jgi:hypothetical protein